MTEQMTSTGVLVLVVAIAFFWITIGTLVGLHRARAARRSLHDQRRIS